MAVSGNYLLIDPHPRRHIVYPYTNEEKAVNAVYLFASSGFSKGESVILIMADSHAEAIKARLFEGRHGFESLEAEGRLECISADAILRELTAGGRFDEARFQDWIGGVIDRARANSPSGEVRIFGEIVSLLWSRNEVALAEQLEILWRDVVERYDISLFCCYALLESGFKILPESLTKLHSHRINDSRDEWDKLEQGASA